MAFEGTWREDAVRRGFLPVYADWECSYALTADGEPVYDCESNWEHPHPLTNQRHRFVVLAQVARRYPELASLAPERGPNDPTCPSCKGTGTVRVEGKEYSNLMCECGGLGWFPTGSELGPC